MELFSQEVVLFKSSDDEEGLEVACTIAGDGSLIILQESSGPLTEWSFEESPHRLEVVVEPVAACSLAEHFHLDDVRQLPFALRMEFTGYDCCQQIRLVMRYLGVSYRVVEEPVVR